MGACQSRQPAAAVVEGKLHLPNAASRKDPNAASATTPSLTSNTTGMTRELSELESACHTYHHENAPIPEEPIPSVISDIPVIEQSAHKRPSTSQGPGHSRKKSGALVKEYLQAESASCNRVMVHIETPFGLPIEEVYDGVHTGEELGRGVAGIVRLITHRSTGIQRAVKRLDLGLITTDEDMDRLLEEIKIMCTLDHPNIVCLEEVFEGENELFLTQELCKGGDLFDRLDEQPDQCYTEAKCAHLIKQIISSVQYLHSKGVIHRDLKLENFLFQDKADESELKMIDFGLSKHFVRGEMQHDAVGTPYTVAPEVLRGEGYEEKCDVWGIGVITYLLLSGETPFGGACPGEEDLNEVRLNILSGEVSFDDPIWDNVSILAVDFIKSMLKLDPEERPSASALQDHPWLRSFMKRYSTTESEEEFSSTHSIPNPDVVSELVSFKELTQTKKFLREIISYTLQPEQISGLHEEFDKFDVDGTGEISLHCFKEALIANSDQHPWSEAEIEELFNGLKVRHTDMSIRWHEFLSACLNQCHVDDRNIRLAFDRLDNERKGYITLDDLKGALDFYGSDSRYDLQRMWIEEVLDYKSDKTTMTFDDFYSLLKLSDDKDIDRDDSRKRGEPISILRKSAPPQHNQPRGTLARSYQKPGFVGFETFDEATLALFESPPQGAPGRRRGGRSRALSMGPAMGQAFCLNQNESTSTRSIKASRDIHDFILEAAMRMEVEKRTRKRRTSLTGTKGLFLRRESSGGNSEFPQIRRTLTSG